MVGISTKETEEDVTSLTNSGEEESAFPTDIGTLEDSICKQYLK